MVTAIASTRFILMETLMKTRITRAELESRLARGEPTLILEALPPKYYDEGHIPGAHALDHANVRPQITTLAPQRDATIVVYCASATCRNSDIAANQLDALGYTDVRVYVEGKKDWMEAGLPVVRKDRAA
jgi:rhodanese-related sulfurtransferase